MLPTVGEEGKIEVGPRGKKEGKRKEGGDACGLGLTERKKRNKKRGNMERWAELEGRLKEEEENRKEKERRKACGPGLGKREKQRKRKKGGRRWWAG